VRRKRREEIEGEREEGTPHHPNHVPPPRFILSQFLLGPSTYGQTLPAGGSSLAK